MKRLPVRALSAMALLSAGWLHATPIDPNVKFITGGTHSTDITCTLSGCTTPLSPNIDANGVANIDIFNKSDSGDIISLFFHIPTLNFNHEFNVSTNAFTNAFIFPNVAHDELLVEFLGTGNAAEGGSAFLGADPAHAGDGLSGFERGGTVTVDAYFGTPKPGTFQGFLKGQHATLELSTVPEPGMLWVSLVGLVGLLVAKRRLSNT